MSRYTAVVHLKSGLSFGHEREFFLEDEDALDNGINSLAHGIVESGFVSVVSGLGSPAYLVPHDQIHYVELVPVKGESNE